MSMSDRKAELEKKKARLQALREEKEKRRLEKERKERSLVAGQTSNQTAPDSLTSTSTAELDSLLHSVGVAPVSDVMDSLTMHGSPSQSLSAVEPSSDSPANTASSPHSHKKKTAVLSVVNVHSTDIAPREKITYAKQTQTVSTGPEHHSRGVDYYVLTYDDDRAGDEDSSLTALESGGTAGGGGKVRLPPGILHRGMPRVTDVRPATVPADGSTQSPGDNTAGGGGGNAAATTTLPKTTAKPREMSKEEKHNVFMSDEFADFFHRQSRVMERALAEECDYFDDYSRNFDDETIEDKSGMCLSLNRVFCDERWSKNRIVTSMDWSPQFPELMVASYNNNDEAPNEPDGVCLVWNTKYKKTTPEYVFHCQSPVMCATFARFHPNLIVGGTYSGQIVLWDNRCSKRTPVQRSPLSAAAHTHPIYCMRVVGSQNAHNLISISTDGRMRSWSLDMLSQPQETMELLVKQGKCVAVTALDFPQSEVNNFVVGAEDGCVYTACRHGSRAGVQDVFEAHHGPVTGVSCHAAPGPLDFSHLFVSASFDWTLKLWSSRQSRPLHSFDDNADYVLDTAWSPVHPALLATADAAGRLDVWNINGDIEVPAASVVVDGRAALNRLSWTPSGMHVTAGDCHGRLWLYDLGERLCQPRVDEWSRMARALQHMHNNINDELDAARLAPSR